MYKKRVIDLSQPMQQHLTSVKISDRKLKKTFFIGLAPSRNSLLPVSPSKGLQAVHQFPYLGCPISSNAKIGQQTGTS